MKSVTNKGDQQEIRNRLNAPTADAPRQWGTMSAHQMMCNLTDSFRLTTGERRRLKFCEKGRSIEIIETCNSRF